MPSANLGKHFEEAARFIRTARQQKGKVLVHCWAGVSRSSSCVIAYLMRDHRKSLRAAYDLVKRLRKVIRPN
jgi:protein-tyrosine phosphatase